MKAEMRDNPCPSALWRSLLCKPASAPRSGSEDRPLPLVGRRIRVRRALHSGGAAGVAVMQAAQPGKGHDFPHDGRFDWSVFRGILGQGQMAPILVVPGAELSKQATGMPVVPDDDVVETLSAQGCRSAARNRRSSEVPQRPS